MDIRKEFKKLITTFVKNSNNKNLKLNLLGLIASLVLAKINNKSIQQISNQNEFLNLCSEEIRQTCKILNINDLKIDLLNTFNYSALVNLINMKNVNLDNIISWAYQYFKFDLEKTAFNNSLEKGIKIDGENITATTQFFTEDYMINYINSEITKHYKLSLDTKIIDPCCGGGNFLTNIMERFYNENPNSDELKSFIENCLYGFELDKDLANVACLNLYLKYVTLTGKNELMNMNIYTFSEFDERGSLYKQTNQPIINVLTKMYVPYSTILENDHYDIVITNPPFMGPRNMSNTLLQFIKENYPLSKGDLCNAFIEKCIRLTKKTGMIGLVTQNSWLYLTNYQDFRNSLFSTSQLCKIVELGSNAFQDLNGEKTRVVLCTIKREKPSQLIETINLSALSHDEKVNYFQDINSFIYGEVDQLELLFGKENAFKHQSTNKLDHIFSDFPKYSDFAVPMQGTSTGDSKNLVDYSWNHPNDKNWLFVSKGGGYCRWNGLNFYRVKWGPDAKYIKLTKGHALRNVKYFAETDLVYSDTGTQGLSVRLLKEKQIFIASGPGIRILEGSKYNHLAFLNSRISNYFLSVLSPKLTISAGYIGKIPVPKELIYSTEFSTLGEKTLKLKEKLSALKLDNIEYSSSKYFSMYGQDIFSDILAELKLELEKLELEKQIEDIIAQHYDLSLSDVIYIYNELGKPVYEYERGLPKLSIKELEKEWSKVLNLGCRFKGTTSKKKFGVDGALEYLSQQFNVHPKDLFNFICTNLKSFPKIIKKYQDDLVHKLLLSELKYEHHCCKKDRCYINKINVDNIDINEWIQNEFTKVHDDVFKKSPIVSIIDDSLMYIITE